MKPDRATLIERAGKYFAETCRLEAELAEARAQIAARDAEIEGLLEELRAARAGFVNAKVAREPMQ